ncbi:MAG: stage V sporulation protein S [Chloroflexi bacterium]|nr:stage V sporulation protein S [Chloroflexota bacterium]
MVEDKQVKTLKVAATSRSTAVASAIAGVVRDWGWVELQAIGAEATNRAVKAIAFARNYLQADGLDVVCMPSFVEVRVDNQDKTALRFIIERR